MTQQFIDALPATTKIPEKFRKVISLPPIAPGESVWFSVDFTLPDPGTYNIYSDYPTKYIDASQINECSNLTAFFASYIRVEMTTEFRRTQTEVSYPWPGADPTVHATYGRQLPQAFFKFMNIPPGKYDGKCK